MSSLKYKAKDQAWSPESGLTMLEIIFSITLLLIMTMATASVLRNGIDMRIELSQKSRVTHRINTAMEKISDDLQHVFLLNSQLVFSRRADIKTMFRVKPWDSSMELRLTTQNHVPRNAGRNESDQTFVVYRIEKDTSAGNRPHLLRGESPTIPENLEQDIPMTVIARNIKSLKIQLYDGEEWRDDWDSTRSDWRDMLPRMVRVEVEAYVNEPLTDEEPIGENDPTEMARTIIYLPRANLTKEKREAGANSQPKYY